MKTVQVTRESLRKRLQYSLLAGFVFILFTLGTFIFIRYGPTENRLPVALRQVQDLNGTVGRKLVSENRRAPLKPSPPAGKKPRVNGLIGLEDDVDPETYRVVIESGLKKVSLSLTDFDSMPRTSASTDFKCVEGWTEVFSYSGVRFTDFMKLENVGYHEDGTPYPYVGMETPDGKYYVSLDIKSMMAPDTILSFEMNGAELDVENGYPLRLMVPSKYGIKNLKRIGRIFFSDTRPPDYWHRRGYDWFSGL